MEAAPPPLPPILHNVQPTPGKVSVEAAQVPRSCQLTRQTPLPHPQGYSLISMLWNKDLLQLQEQETLDWMAELVLFKPIKSYIKEEAQSLGATGRRVLQHCRQGWDGGGCCCSCRGGAELLCCSPRFCHLHWDWRRV